MLSNLLTLSVNWAQKIPPKITKQREEKKKNNKQTNKLKHNTIQKTKKMNNTDP